MAIYDRTTDMLGNDPGPRMTAGGMSPPLSEQTPGLDRTSRIRSLAMRPVSFVRERPDIAAAIFGGIAVIGLGTFLAMRSRKVSRLEEIKSKAEELLGWLRSRV